MARKNNSAAATRGRRKAEAEAEDAASTSSSDAADDAAGVASDGEKSDESMSDGGGSGSGSDDDGSEERPDSQMEESDDGSDEEESDDDDGDDDDAGGGGGGGRGGPRPSAAANSDEHCTFDLSNLATFNTHQVDVARLHSTATSSSSEGGGLDRNWYAATPTIAAATGSATLLPVVNESFLLSKAAEGATQLLAELWTLPTERTDVGPKARLPSGGGDTVKLPRALPPPPPKQLSKWEQFALQRGIAPKSKRSRKAFDESTGEWKHLTGSLQDKANAGPESWPIIEVKKNDDPMADPWEKIRDEKKTRVQKNTEARMRNAERAGTLAKGSANRLAKNADRLEKQRDIARERERRRGLEAPAGVPLDVGKPDARRGKPSTQLALRATQVSTASLGRFDRQREGEPEKKKALSGAIHGDGRKRKQVGGGGDGDGGGGTNKKFLQGEAQKSSDILKRVMDGGSASKEKERDVRRGKYAKGETAYDNEFDDGLGAGSFKKKKGRAGMGKMKKMTKKRIK